MEKQITEQVNQEHKRKDHDSLSIVELIREFRKDPKVMAAAKKIAATS